MRKCKHDGSLICSAAFNDDVFLRGVGLDKKGYIYVVCSSAYSKVFKLNKDMKKVRKAHDDSSEHLGQAYELLVTPDDVLVCSYNKICIFNFELDLCFTLKLDFDPYGITIHDGKYFATGKGTIGVIEIKERERFKTMTWKNMKINGQECRTLRGIASSHDYLLVTENDSNSPRLLLLYFENDDFKYVNTKDDFPNDEGKTISPIVVTHCNGAFYYSEGRYGKDFHIVKATITNTTIKTELIYNV